VDTITTDDVLQVLSPIWTTKTETAKRVQGRIENVLDYAAPRVTIRDPLNPARWRGHLDKLLPKPARVKRVEHFPAMPHTEVPAFMALLDSSAGVAALALRFLILTATRTSEVLKATWEEVDLEREEWTHPGRADEGRQAASRAAIAASHGDPRSAPRGLEGTPYVFPGARQGRPLSNMALLTLMRRLGYGVGGDRGDSVPHGFRSSFRDWASEVSSFPREVAEIGPRARGREPRGGGLPPRRLCSRSAVEMMGDWADYLAG
jgi:integrase